MRSDYVTNETFGRGWVEAGLDSGNIPKARGSRGSVGRGQKRRLGGEFPVRLELKEIRKVTMESEI